MPGDNGTRIRSDNGTLTFFRAFLAHPHRVGAIIPSSRQMARAVIAPFALRTRPARVLEVGAGTGAVTRHIGYEMGPADELAICELQPALADHVEREVLSEPQFADAVRQGRVKLARCAIQDFHSASRFDYVICGLPFTAFRAREVHEILRVVRRLLKPGGVFSYFEYLALRRLRTLASIGPARRRVRRVSSILDAHIDRFQISRQIVLANFPPARARHWRFD